MHSDPPPSFEPLFRTSPFLDTIGPKAKAWTFQTFDDEPDKQLKNGKLARVLHGTLAEHAWLAMARLVHVPFEPAPVAN